MSVPSCIKITCIDMTHACYTYIITVFRPFDVHRNDVYSQKDNIVTSVILQ